MPHCKIKKISATSIRFQGFDREIFLRFSWNITQRTMVIPYRRFGTSYRSHSKSSRNKRNPVLDFLKMGPTD
jgi:hypothetical protein